MTKPPHLKIDTQELRFTAKSGERLLANLTLQAEEPKPIYSEAWTDQDWVKIGTIKHKGNSASIPLAIEVPGHLGQSAKALVTVQGNSKQRFVIPVNVTVIGKARPRHLKAEFRRRGAAAMARLVCRELSHHRRFISHRRCFAAAMTLRLADFFQKTICGSNIQ